MVAAPGLLTRDMHVAGRNKNIKDIDLGAVFFTHEDRETLALITSFDLSHNCIEKLLHLDALVSLTNLDVSYNCIHTIGVLPTTITQLDLSHNRLTTLENLGSLRNLVKLDLSHNKLDSFAGLSPISTLQLLRADNNCISSTSGLESMSSLHFLSLDHNFIDSTNDLVFLSSLKRLELLSLCGNPVMRLSGYKKLVAQLCPSLLSLDGVPLECDAAKCVTVVDEDELLTPVARREPCPLPHPFPNVDYAGLTASRAPDNHDVSRRCGTDPHLTSILDEGMSGGKSRSTRTRAGRQSTASKGRGGSFSAVHENAEFGQCSPPVVEAPGGGTPSITKENDTLHECAERLQPPKLKQYHRKRNLPLSEMRDVGAPSVLLTTPSYASKIALKAASLPGSGSDKAAPLSTLQLPRDIEGQLREMQVLVEELRKENEYLRTRDREARSQLKEARRIVVRQLGDINNLKQRCAAAEQFAAASKDQIAKIKRRTRAVGKYTHSAVDAMVLEQERLRVGYEAQIADLNMQLKRTRTQLKRAAPGGTEGPNPVGVSSLHAASNISVLADVEVSLEERAISPIVGDGELSLVLSPTDTTASSLEHPTQCGCWIVAQGSNDAGGALEGVQAKNVEDGSEGA